MARSIRNIRLDDNLDRIDMARLNASGYHDKCDEWNKVFVIRHKKYPEKVAELRALSFTHACSLIGWRPRQVEIIDEFDIEQ
jgi:hypothetical protein